MKYIRTKDGRIGEITSWNERHNQFFCKINGEMFSDNNIVVEKQADTIEELCDELVIIGEFGNFLVNPEELDKHADGQTKEMLENGLLQCYGAIWTTGEHGEPILKSIAKMNDKGELELL